MSALRILELEIRRAVACFEHPILPLRSHTLVYSEPHPRPAIILRVLIISMAGRDYDLA